MESGVAKQNATQNMIAKAIEFTEVEGKTIPR